MLSAMHGVPTYIQVALTSHADSNTSKYDANLVQLARKIGMKSETRVAVFCTLCTATDAHAAFEALNRLRLKVGVDI
jgi:hypothetical protein